MITDIDNLDTDTIEAEMLRDPTPYMYALRRLLSEGATPSQGHVPAARKKSVPGAGSQSSEVG